MSAARVARIGADLGVKPLSARSVVAAALMRTDDGSMSAATLVRAAELFGVTEGAARVAMSRMTSAGEIRSVDGHYRLSGRMVPYQRRSTGARWPEVGGWDGTWVMQVVTVEGRTHNERQSLRKAMRGVRFAQVAGGTWLRPDNIVAGQPAELEAIIAEQCERFVIARVDDPHELAGRLWDLPAWDERARRILTAITKLRPAISAGDAPAFAPGLIVTAAAVVHVSNDPMLPADLAPPDWLGPELRAALDEHDALSEQMLRERTSP